MTNILVIDCFKQVKGAGKSIGIYNLALNLVRRMAAKNEAVPDDNKKKIIVFGNRYNREDFDVDGIEFVEIQKNPLNKLYCVWWELFAVSAMAKRYHADRILFPRGYASLLHRTQEYIIIHDMIPFYYNEHFPNYFNKLENFYIMWRLKASAKSADAVITISQASKQDILKYAKIDEKKITVINNGANPMPDMELKESNEEYLIAITSGLPHKNATGIIESYIEYTKRCENPLPIKIIGISATYLDECKVPIDDSLRNKITCIKYIEKNEDLYQMIHGAKAFLFLSLIEGFGFPPVEAMQLGTPVICSDTSSLPEVAGRAVHYVNPQNPEQVADMICKVLNTSTDIHEMIKRGKENVERFSWEKIEKAYWEKLFED